MVDTGPETLQTQVNAQAGTTHLVQRYCELPDVLVFAMLSAMVYFVERPSNGGNMKISTRRPEGLLGCPRKCYSEHTTECVFAREVKYLSQVGCLDHLNEIAHLVGVEPGVDKTLYEVCDGPTPAFREYERALDTACKALEGGIERLTGVVRYLVPALAEATLVRAHKAAGAKQDPHGHHCAPGRHEWLRRVEV